MPSITITKITDYIGNFVYQDDVLQYISTAEGRAVYSPTDAIHCYSSCRFYQGSFDY